MRLLPPGWRKYWIRRDRDLYLLAGVMVSAIISSLVSASWHAEDRLRMLRNIKPQIPKKEQAAPARSLDKLREAEFIPGKRKVLEKYYRMDSDGESAVPDLDEEEGE